MTTINQLPAGTPAAGDAIPFQSATSGETLYATPPDIASAAGMLVAAQNLADLENAQAARANLGLGAVATLAVGNGLVSNGTVLAVEFGTTTGTVADGGALASETTARVTGQTNNANAAAAAQATADAAMPNTNAAILSLLTLVVTTFDLPNSPPEGGGWWINGTGTSGVLTYYNGTET